MARLVFHLNQVPEDEADAVRALLEDANIEFYETHAGKWGISVAALWLYEDADFDRARALIDDFQDQWRHSARRQETGFTHETLLQRWRRRPVDVVLVLLALSLILGLTLWPFLAAFR